MKSVSLSHSRGDSSPFILRDINDQELLFPVIYFSLLVSIFCAFLQFLEFAALRSSMVCIFVDVAKFLGLEFSFYCFL